MSWLVLRYYGPGGRCEEVGLELQGLDDGWLPGEFASVAADTLRAAIFEAHSRILRARRFWAALEDADREGCRLTVELQSFREVLTVDFLPERSDVDGGHRWRGTATVVDVSLAPLLLDEEKVRALEWGVADRRAWKRRVGR